MSFFGKFVYWSVAFCVGVYVCFTLWFEYRRW